ncbi:MAG: translation initiation factor IF-2 subunit gamma [Candidatus Aenigmarchaeota archaeon]|nr:translation initiation factor IF-2 subunit gamma [Candidatus Aenigmarchaeota archaeon]
MKEDADSRLLPDINVGMIGHVDHGKTTLTAALTGKFTDTHSEEIKRGITIRLGYADATIYKCSKCPSGQYGISGSCSICHSRCEPFRTISFVDAPGHETLMTTMLSGTAIMDAALLLVSASEPCPQPQTREHLKALDIVNIRNVIIVQNKIDLVTREQALDNYRQIKSFVKGTVAEDAPIVPVSAQQKINMDILVETLAERLPKFRRDSKGRLKMLIARSFDVNRPGTKIDDLRGGVLGGSILSGTLRVGEEVEIRPGIGIKNKYRSIFTRVVGLQKAGSSTKEAASGGLVGISTSLDPSLTKSDSLAGNILGLPGELPEIFHDLSIRSHLLDKVVGTKEEMRAESIKTHETLLLTVGISRTIATVISSSDKVEMKLKMPVCAEKGERVAISRQILGRWRLIGWGEIL